MRFLSRCTLRCPLLSIVGVELNRINLVSGKTARTTQRCTGGCWWSNNCWWLGKEISTKKIDLVNKCLWGIAYMIWQDLLRRPIGPMKRNAYLRGLVKSRLESVHHHSAGIDHPHPMLIPFVGELVYVEMEVHSDNWRREYREWNWFLNPDVGQTLKRVAPPTYLILTHRRRLLYHSDGYNKCEHRRQCFSRHVFLTEELFVWSLFAMKCRYDCHLPLYASSDDSENWMF